MISMNIVEIDGAEIVTQKRVPKDQILYNGKRLKVAPPENELETNDNGIYGFLSILAPVFTSPEDKNKSSQELSSQRSSHVHPRQYITRSGRISKCTSESAVTGTTIIEDDENDWNFVPKLGEDSNSSNDSEESVHDVPFEHRLFNTIETNGSLGFLDDEEALQIAVAMSIQESNHRKLKEVKENI